ncbi:MAG: hypothetical protein AABX65_03945 [Nanoarchaeota archaeon]
MLFLLSILYLPQKDFSNGKITGLATLQPQDSQGNVSDGDVLVWQGQYYIGTEFQTGTYEFEFTVYDAQEGGNICYTNTTTFTTGNWGEWKTEQTGVGVSCDNGLANYFLEIKINNETQSERRRITNFNFVRKDAFSLELSASKNILIDGSKNLRNMTMGVMRFEHAPLIPNTRAITFNINSNSQENTSAIVMEYNVGGNGSYLIRQFTTDNIYTWDGNGDLSIRDIFAEFIGSLANRITKLFVQDIDASGNINTNGNVTANKFIGDGSQLTGLSGNGGNQFDQNLNTTNSPSFVNITSTNTGFFSFLGSLANRITKLFVQEIDVEKSIKIGYTVQGVCDANTEGTIIYDNSGDKREFWGCRQKKAGEYEWVKLS